MLNAPARRADGAWADSERPRRAADPARIAGLAPGAMAAGLLGVGATYVGSIEGAARMLPRRATKARTARHGPLQSSMTSGGARQRFRGIGHPVDPTRFRAPRSCLRSRRNTAWATGTSTFCAKCERWLSREPDATFRSTQRERSAPSPPTSVSHGRSAGVSVSSRARRGSLATCSRSCARRSPARSGCGRTRRSRGDERSPARASRLRSLHGNRAVGAPVPDGLRRQDRRADDPRVVFGGETPVVVDVPTSRPELVRERFGRTLVQDSEQRPAAALAGVGVDPNEVGVVVLSTFTGITRWVWTKTCFPTRPCMCSARSCATQRRRDGPHAPLYDGPTTKRLLPAFACDYPNVVVIDGDFELFDGLQIVHLPGHTPGLQGIVVETADGRIVMASDTVPFSSSWRGPTPADWIPEGIHVSLTTVTGRWRASLANGRRSSRRTIHRCSRVSGRDESPRAGRRPVGGRRHRAGTPALVGARRAGGCRLRQVVELPRARATGWGLARVSLRSRPPARCGRCAFLRQLPADRPSNAGCDVRRASLYGTASARLRRRSALHHLGRRSRHARDPGGFPGRCSRGDPRPPSRRRVRRARVGFGRAQPSRGAGDCPCRCRRERDRHAHVHGWNHRALEGRRTNASLGSPVLPARTGRLAVAPGAAVPLRDTAQPRRPADCVPVFWHGGTLVVAPGVQRPRRGRPNLRDRFDLPRAVAPVSDPRRSTTARRRASRP